MANYTSEQETLRAAINNFIGVAASSSMYEGKDAVRNVIALFLEELVKYIQTDDGMNMNAAKPILRATVYILESRRKEAIESFKEAFDCEPNELLTEDLDRLIQSMNDYINKL